MEDLSAHLSISRRTLFRAVDKEIGMSPARFMRYFRLSQVRRELADVQDDERTVTSAATNRGFWNLGQFAADYRQIFGELPSKTLER